MTTTSHLFAYLFRLRHINRWSLMRNMQDENVAEHTLNVCFIVHALCSIANHVFKKQVPPTEKIVLAALGHDASELFTGDNPTPITYHNQDILVQFRHLEELAWDRLMNMVPEELKSVYQPLFKNEDAEIKRWIKAVDLCDALLKCKSELAAGNREFSTAERQIRLSIYQLNMPEVDYFLDIFTPSLEKTLDEISSGSQQLTEGMIPPMEMGVYESTVENEVIATLHELCEDGYATMDKDYEWATEVIDGVQRFLNERGIGHVVFERGQEMQIHLNE